MIKKIRVANFRCLKNVELKIENDMTVIVGENDCGKSSIIHALKIIFQNLTPEIDDFHNSATEMTIEVEMEDKSLIKKFIRDAENEIILETTITISKDSIENIKTKIDSEEFIALEETEKKDILFDLSGEIGLKPRSNTVIPTLINNIHEKIEEIENNDYNFIPSSFPGYNTIFLDGTKFNDINSTFKQIHFKEIRNKIWFEKLEDGSTIEEVILNKLGSYSTKLQEEIEEEGFIEKLKGYLPELTGIKIEPQFHRSDINVGVKVQFLDGINEIPVNKKGDGTRRRITMALLEYQKELDEEITSYYIFDEPDTHLHVKAQVEFLDIIKRFTGINRQIIVTTHSPFIINAVKPKQIRVLSLEDNSTKIQPLFDDGNVRWTLDLLGITNTNLFFSRKILIVEGESEEIFIKIAYERFFGNNLHNDLVKLIKREGIEDVPRFAEVLTQFVQPDDIYILIDNDGDEETENLISNLKLDENNLVKMGLKEFEDSFESNVIYNCWKIYVEDKCRTIGESWTIENIETMKEECKANGWKFSKKLRSLNGGCVTKMTKPILAKVLAENIAEEDMDKELYGLLENLSH
ncbi:ATP-dependent nuclease [Methanobacterium sp. MBAC-LM]|uniref:ATP-dependent nuclease n=1 Tax=Methanobacterium sp. MBAC-LM TaxID=3412034 RepID=UPI003C716CF7